MIQHCKDHSSFDFPSAVHNYLIHQIKGTGVTRDQGKGKGRQPRSVINIRVSMQQRRKAFMTAFATEKDRGDNLSLSTVELRYATMDSRTALLLSSTDIFHTCTCKIILSLNCWLSSLESPVIAPSWRYPWRLYCSEGKFQIAVLTDRGCLLSG